MTSSFKPVLAVLHLATAFVAMAAAGQASALTAHVTVDTIQVAGSASAPFYLDFQFNNGSGALGNNTVTLSNFTGLGAIGTASTLGAASGSIGSTVSFNNGSAFQELWQSFTAGQIVGFDITTTTNVDAGGVPDLLSFTLLTSDLANISTTGVADSLLVINLNASPIFETGRGTGEFAGVSVSVTPVPEPATWALMAAGIGLLAWRASARSSGSSKPGGRVLQS